MKVRVSPPYEGAGSFEVEAEKAGKYYWTVKGERLEEAWCEEITEITPEPGDICEFFGPPVPNPIGILMKKHRMLCGVVYTAEGHEEFFDNCRVLARKPKRWTEAKDAVWRFWSDIADSSKDGERAAYERFLADILGVPYARVGE